MRFPEGVTISVIIVDEIQSWNVNYIELIMLGSVSVLMALIHWRHFVKKLGFQIPAEVGQIRSRMLAEFVRAPHGGD